MCPLARRAGIVEDMQQPRTYLRHALGAHYRAPLVDAFLDNAGPMVAFFEQHTALQFVDGNSIPDMRSELPGAATQGHQVIEARDQLFGEAVAMMNAGVLWYPTRDQQDRLISPEQENREIPDPWHGHIYRYLEGLDADGNEKVNGKINRVTVLDLLTRGLHFEISKLGPAKLETMRIGAIMRKLGWTKDRETSGARERFYARPAPAPKPGAEPTREDDDVPLPF